MHTKRTIGRRRDSEREVRSSLVRRALSSSASSDKPGKIIATSSFESREEEIVRCDRSACATESTPSVRLSPVLSSSESKNHPTSEMASSISTYVCFLATEEMIPSLPPPSSSGTFFFKTVDPLITCKPFSSSTEGRYMRKATISFDVNPSSSSRSVL